MGDSTRLALLSAGALWLGATLVFSELRWFSRRPLTDRLRRHVAGGAAAAGPAGVLSVASFREVIGPVAREVGERAARVVGVGEDLATRLTRIHSPLDPTAFRLRQLGWAVAGLVGGVALAAATAAPAALALLFVAGGPVLAFLVVEQRLANRSNRWQRRITLELPVVSEQLAMLLGAGYSLGAALNRLASRGAGACSQDLTLVCGRIRQGLTEVEALREWALIARVDPLARLVGVLALNREAGDLGRLIGEEARSIRREVQRDLIEQIERRSQQVWIPVTVATLVPGSMLLAVPFMDALRLFSSS
jgi:tight adherence protein C